MASTQGGNPWLAFTIKGIPPNGGYLFITTPTPSKGFRKILEYLPQPLSRGGACSGPSCFAYLGKSSRRSDTILIFKTSSTDLKPYF
jgi:hypothetical protein